MFFELKEPKRMLYTMNSRET